MNAHAFLTSLTIVLAVAAVTTVLCHLLRQPVVLGYLVAGVLVGPAMPVPALVDPAVIQTLSELGVILLMFSLGLEFSLRRLVRGGVGAGLTALLETSLMIWLGFVVARALGWSSRESLFAGAIVSISSTAIASRALAEGRAEGPLRELVLGVLLVEDLIAILLVAALTALSTGTGLSAANMAVTASRLAFFLAALVAVGMLLVPRGARLLHRLGRPEITLIASVGFCFAVSCLARALGYSVALGAFIAGSLLAESGEHREIERLVRPLRDVFVAIFFVSVGVLIDPAAMLRHGREIAALTALVLVGKVVGVTTGALLTGHSARTSLQSGMSMAQIGEFSFILAALGTTLHATRPFVYPVAVAVSAVTTLATPWLARASRPAVGLLDRVIPERFHTFAALYASWIDQLRRRPQGSSRGARIRRLARRLVLDATLTVLIVVAASLARGRLVGFVRGSFSLGPWLARAVVVAAVLVAVAPLLAGVIRVSQRLGLTLAEGALPRAKHGAVDLARAPRRALVVTLQLALVLLTGLPILAVTQPTVGGLWVPACFAVLVGAAAVSFLRGATELQGHVQAGVEAIVEALFANAPGDAERASDAAGTLEQVRTMLRGLGEPVPVGVPRGSAAVGRSLAALDLRGGTGATVLAIRRGEREIIVPAAEELVQAGDVLALAGSHDAIQSARRALGAP